MRCNFITERSRDLTLDELATGGGDHGGDGAFTAVSHRHEVVARVRQHALHAGDNRVCGPGCIKALLERIGRDDDLHGDPSLPAEYPDPTCLDLVTERCLPGGGTHGVVDVD